MFLSDEPREGLQRGRLVVSEGSSNRDVQGLFNSEISLVRFCV